MRTLFFEKWKVGHRFGCVVLVSVLWAGSCGKSHPGPNIQRVKVFPAKGQLSLGGQPTKGALLVFHPVDGGKPPFPLPRAHAAEDGTFAIGTYESADGAPPGEYKVIVEHHLAKQIDGEWTNGPNIVPAAYASVQTTTLRVSLTEGENTLPPLAVPAQ